MPGKHKNPAISFRPTEYERIQIETRIAMSGMQKRQYIVRACIYSNIVVVGKKKIYSGLWMQPKKYSRP